MPVTSDTRGAAARVSVIRRSASLGWLEAIIALFRAALPHVLLWGVLVRTLGIPYWITAAVAVPAGGVLGATFLALRAPQETPVPRADEGDEG